jgi:antitoxin PrlF
LIHLHFVLLLIGIWSFTTSGGRGKAHVEISKISSKGQVTIPKIIREMLQLDAGDRIFFIEENGRAYLTKASLDAINRLHLMMTKDAADAGISEQELEHRQDEEWENFWSGKRESSG